YENKPLLWMRIGCQMTHIQFPEQPEDITAELLSSIIDEAHPDVHVTDFKISETHRYGDGLVSSAGRLELELELAGPGAAALPKHVIVKIARGNAKVDPRPQWLYANEDAFYRSLRKEIPVDAPVWL